MARVSFACPGTDNFGRILNHRPELKEVFYKKAITILENSVLPADLLEQVRAKLAFGRGCKN